MSVLARLFGRRGNNFYYDDLSSNREGVPLINSDRVQPERQGNGSRPKIVSGDFIPTQSGTTRLSHLERMTKVSIRCCRWSSNATLTTLLAVSVSKVQPTPPYSSQVCAEPVYRHLIDDALRGEELAILCVHGQQFEHDPPPFWRQRQLSAV